MTNVVYISSAFKRDAKRLLKKYHTLKDSVDKLAAELTKNPFLGIAYGDRLFKVRLSDSSKGSGKSGGFRVLYYHLKKTDDGIEILLLSIYDKSEKSTIKKAVAVKRLQEILIEEQTKNRA